MDQITTGISKLDELLGGGFPKNAVILVSGGPGAGKTLFGLNYMLEGAKNNETCCYLTLNENKKELLRACTLEQLKSVHKYVDKNLVIESLDIGEEVNLEYFENLFKAYPRTDRLVIDNLNKLLIHAENKRHYRIVLSKTVRYLREKIGSTILICETEGDKMDTGNGEAFESQDAIEVRRTRGAEPQSCRHPNLGPVYGVL